MTAKAIDANMLTVITTIRMLLIMMVISRRENCGRGASLWSEGSAGTAHGNTLIWSERFTQSLSFMAYNVKLFCLQVSFIPICVPVAKRQRKI
jgi:hypothetical protein